MDQQKFKISRHVKTAYSLRSDRLNSKPIQVCRKANSTGPDHTEPGRIIYTDPAPSTTCKLLGCYSVGGWVVRRCHVSFVTRGVQLILAYSWARPAILVAGKGREVMFLFLLFLHFHSCFSFFPVPPFHLFCYLVCLFSPFLWETTQNDPQGLTCR